MHLNRDLMELCHEGRTLQLTRTSFAIVDTLTSHQRIATREVLIKAIDPTYEREWDDDRAIDAAVKRLRRAMRAVFGRDDWIKTVYGVGYRWDHADEPAPRTHKTYRAHERRRKRPYDPSTAT